ncbi:MAG: hypothetical protein CML50_21920 [Rhodobacteraceae bacterium]|nr:hypothetical protein [Paracoccaceae bacterium]
MAHEAKFQFTDHIRTDRAQRHEAAVSCAIKMRFILGRARVLKSISSIIWNVRIFTDPSIPFSAVTERATVD